MSEPGRAARRLGAVAAALRPQSPGRAVARTCAAAQADDGAPRPRWQPAALRQFGAALLEAAGMSAHQAKTVASVAVEGDLLNHNTHGIRLLPTVLKDLGRG